MGPEAVFNGVYVRVEGLYNEHALFQNVVYPNMRILFTKDNNWCIFTSESKNALNDVLRLFSVEYGLSLPTLCAQWRVDDKVDVQVSIRVTPASEQVGAALE